jgi:hypothetical protein
VVTKFNEIFLGYQPCQVSALNQRFKDHLNHHHHHRRRRRRHHQLIAQEDFLKFTYFSNFYAFVVVLRFSFT